MSAVVTPAPTRPFVATGRLAGRRAVVTGGGAGIGLGILRCLVAEGARVLIADLDPVAADVAAALREEFA
ncbi:MAG: hypothetical protein ACI379_15490, partial [Nocardioides sp.]